MSSSMGFRAVMCGALIVLTAVLFAPAAVRAQAYDPLLEIRLAEAIAVRDFDQALQMIAAVREKDDAKLTSCTLWISTTKPSSRTAHSRSRHPVNPFDFRRLPRTTRPGRGLIEIH